MLTNLSRLNKIAIQLLPFRNNFTFNNKNYRATISNEFPNSKYSNSN